MQGNPASDDANQPCPQLPTLGVELLDVAKGTRRDTYVGKAATEGRRYNFNVCALSARVVSVKLLALMAKARLPRAAGLHETRPENGQLLNLCRRLEMPRASELSRRERQIMDVVFALGEATVNQVVEAIPDAPTPMAIRRLMHILEAKLHLRRKKQGREVVYLPRETKAKAGRSAFQRVLETFFGGSLEEALAAHLHARKDGMTDEERERLIQLIEQAKQEGR